MLQLSTTRAARPGLRGVMLEFSIVFIHRKLVPYSYTIDAPNNLVRVKATGVCTYPEVLAVSEAITLDAQYVKGMHSLIDYTEASLEGSNDEVRKYTERMIELGMIRGRAKLAAVTKNSGVTESLVKFFAIVSEVFASPIRARTFYSMAQAEKWLRKTGD